MLICTTSQIESRIFDILQTVLQIDERDLKLVKFEPIAYGYDVKYQIFEYDEWRDDERIIQNCELTLILSFL